MAERQEDERGALRIKLGQSLSIYTVGPPGSHVYSGNNRGISGTLIWINFESGVTLALWSVRLSTS